ncbi:MAG: hypothetical protein VX834_05285, partial [Myxococcota bacterium]|nr:hypothetical protein [Myxococcota bacterium]
WPDCASHDCAGDCDADDSCVPSEATSCDGTCSDYCSGSSSTGASVGPCSPDNPAGDCPAGQVCEDGACVDFECNDTQFEPNDTLANAVDLPNGTTSSLQICGGDKDWYRLDPVSSNTLYSVTVDSNPGSGDLSIRLTDSGGLSASDGNIATDHYHPENGVGPMNIEGHSIVGSPSAASTYFEISGRSGAVNNYTLSSVATPYQDGPNCSVNFDLSDCLSQTNGYHDSSKLLLFPVGHAEDPYIGEGVYFENALQMMSGIGLASYTSSARLWSRRELIMAVRHAIHAVQQAFPGTTALGMGDISMPDGTTPDGHPNGTHYYGANADISYYIKPEYQTQHGNLTYRQICCDAALSDWSCVDTNTSSAAYGTCVGGSEDTHIVDIPRTAMFMAKLAGTGRIRVIGVEAKIDAALDEGLDQLVDQGHITSGERSAAHAVIVTANDHGSWIWHFNHMHVSFKTDGAKSLSSAFEGPWPHLHEDEQLHRVHHYYRSDELRKLIP